MRIPLINTFIRSDSRPALLIWSGCFALVMLVVGLGSWTLWRDFQDRQSAVSFRTQGLAAAIAGYTAAVMQQRRLSMDALADHLLGLAWPLEAAQVKPELQRFVSSDPQRTPLFVSAGLKRWALPEIPTDNVALFPPHSEEPAVWLGGQLQLHGRLWLPMFRSYQHPNGEWLTAGALVPMAILRDHLNSIGLPAGVPIALVDLQGRPYLEQGKLPQQAFVPAEDGWQLMTGDVTPGSFLVRKRVPGYPLQIVIARCPDEYLATWYQQMSLTVSAMLLASLVILGLAAGLVSAWRRIGSSGRRYHQLFQSISDGVLLLGQSGVQEANARAAELFGVDSAECLRALQLLDLCTQYQLDNRQAQHWIPQLLVEVEGGAELFTTLKFRRLDQGAEFVCEVRLSPIQLNRKIYLLVCLHDISARQQAEDELQVSRQKLLEAQRIAGLGVWSWEEGAEHAMWTDGCARIFGLPPISGAYALADFTESILVEDREPAMWAFDRTLKGERLDIELQIERPDGHLRNVLICGELRQHGGHPQVLGAMLDITAQKRVEQRLSERERHYRELVELLPEGLLIHRNSRVIFANPAAARLFAAESVAQFLGLDIFQLIDVSSHQQVRAELKRTLGPDYVPVFQPRHYRRLDGTFFEVEVAAQRLLIDGEVCVQVVIRDVTEQRRLQHDIEAANARLQRLSGQIIEVQERERRHLARELHDDVGQLLTFIKISASGVQRHLEGELEQRQATLVRIAGEALSKVRDLSRMLRPVQLDSLGLAAAMRWQVEHYLPDLPEGVRCQLHCAELSPRPSSSVETTLFRIFQEALSNVLKHSAASQVEVQLERVNDEIHLHVRDDGCGFDYAAALHSGQGMGLLSMAERTKLLGGQFVLSSSLGVGTEIWVGLPDNHNNEAGDAA